MKLNVFLLTKDTINDLFDLPAIDEHYNWIVIRPNAISTYEKLSKLIRKYKPVVFCSIGLQTDWSSMLELPYQYRKHWIHYNTVKEIQSSSIEYCYMDAITKNRCSKENPLFSVISTTFHSGEKIFRPYNSLKNQTYTNWEWVLWDDSKEEHKDIWKQLLQFQENDIRIQCYRAPQHSGYIGEMKWLSSSLCKGDWIVEVDHDDIIDDRLFEWCNEAIQKYPDADFLCSSCVELHEDDEAPFSYGDFSAFGHVGYHKEWLRGKWHNVYHVPYMNPKTIRHIVGVPNHVRIWKRTFYEKIGKHNPDLPVVDDYELLLRSYLEGKWVYINAPTYFQYRNRGGNNFTFLRNSLIQHLTKNIYNTYMKQIENFWKEKGVHIEDYNYDNYKLWEKADGFNFNYGYDIYTPNTTNNTVAVILSVENESKHDILKTIHSVVKQEYTDWIIYIVGNKSQTLNNAMDWIRTLYDDSIINKIRWWNLETYTNRQIALNYAHRMLVHTEWMSYLEIGNIWDKDFLSKNMAKLIQSDKKIAISNKVVLYDSIHHYTFLREFKQLSDNEVKSILQKIISEIKNS